MIRKFEYLKNCGIFEDYHWDTGLPTFARINVVFGPNGSGKTSLASALDGLRHLSEDEGYKRVSLAVEDSNGTRVTGGQDDLMFDRMLVFSEHYVLRSHNFTPAEANMKAVLTIGEKPVEVEKKLEALRQTVANKTKEHDEAVGAERTANQAIENAFGRVSQQVVDAASRAGGRWHSRSNFSAGVVRTAFGRTHVSWATLSEKELQDRIAVVNSAKANPLPVMSLISNADENLRKRIESALETRPSSIILESLAAHPEATTWVDDGRHLHDGVDTCIYCGSTLTSERRAQIDQHFSDAVEKLQVELRSIATELGRIAQDVDNAFANIPNRGLLFEDFRTRYDNVSKEIREELALLKKWTIVLRDKVEKKSANPLAEIISVVSDVPVVLGKGFIELLNEHNARVDGHDGIVEEAARQIELHYLKEAEKEVAVNEATTVEQHAKAAEIDEQIRGLTEDIIALEGDGGDPTQSAKVLTEEVARLLGRNELKFESVNNRYEVTRDGKPAVGLSMGERTAITLVHFLETVARFIPSNGKPIVVIDDPVSSFDSDIFMGISTYIWAECVAKDHIAQVVLLTHNFELFRQWDIQIEGLPGAGGAKSRYPSMLYEIRPTYKSVAGKLRRQPRLVAWPSTPDVRKKMRSTYQHAFMTLAQALNQLQADDSMERKLDAQLLFPNVVRRMLETFLAFKHPEWVGNFNEAMRKSKDLLVASNYKGDADVLRLRLTRYAHAYSHSDTPATDITVSPDEVATAISAVFEFMNCLDSAHFRGLCEVVGMTPESLLPTPQEANIERIETGGGSS
jgi:wobble nucleotide-excising tRNase